MGTGGSLCASFFHDPQQGREASLKSVLKPATLSATVDVTWGGTAKQDGASAQSQRRGPRHGGTVGGANA